MTLPGTFNAPIKITTPEVVDTPQPAVPAGVTLSKPRVEVHVEGVFELSGQVRYARALDGPPELQAAAADAVAKWRYKPATMFGFPIPLVLQAAVAFTRP